jgi:hypothetical protein
MKHLTTVPAALVSLLLVSSVAHADERADAEARFRDGVALQKVEDFDAAIQAYESSLELYPSKSALFNLANCLKAVHRYPEALRAFERLLAEHGPELDGVMRTAAQEQVRTLQSLTGTLSVAVSPEGAEVFVDGESVGKSPHSQSLALSVGTHEVEGKLDGFVPQRVIVRIRSQQSATVKLTLAEASAPAPSLSVVPARPQPSPPLGLGGARQPPAEESHPWATPGWLTTGLGAALLVGGTATGLWALGIDRSLDDDCVEGHCPASRANDIDRLEALASATNVLLASGAAVTAAGVILLVVDPGRRTPAEQERGAEPSEALGFGVGSGQAFIRYQRAF